MRYIMPFCLIFQYYSVYSSFVGFVLCVAIMFLMSWVTALITFGILACLFFSLVYIKPGEEWTAYDYYKPVLLYVEF
jgi:solute carrier family 12 sodium/potassium/chloride transporter 2